MIWAAGHLGVWASRLLSVHHSKTTLYIEKNFMELREELEPKVEVAQNVTENVVRSSIGEDSSLTKALTRRDSPTSTKSPDAISNYSSTSYWRLDLPDITNDLDDRFLSTEMTSNFSHTKESKVETKIEAKTQEKITKKKLFWDPKRFFGGK